jgi:hypothetical protein
MIPLLCVLHHIISYHIITHHTSSYIISYHHTSHHTTSSYIISRHITSYDTTSSYTSRHECHNVHHITHYISPYLTSHHLTSPHLTTLHHTTSGAAPHREGQTVLAHAGRQGGSNDCGSIHQFHTPVSQNRYGDMMCDNI